MKLNPFERLLMNNPARGLVQRFYEGPLLRRLGGRLDGAQVLEVGCGQGMGIRVLLEQFGAAHVTGVDLDPRQIDLARHKLVSHAGRVSLAVASADRLPFPDKFFDAVFDFGILHHVPAWQSAVAELCRVLKPSGKLFFEEITSDALNRWSYRVFLKHPKENRFSEAQFVRELQSHNAELLAEPRRTFRNDIFIGVAQLK